MLLILYPVNKGTLAKLWRLKDINIDDTLGIWHINIKISISKLPNIKLKQVTISPPNFFVLFFPRTPYKAKVRAAKSVKVTPAGERFVDKGLIIIKIPIISKTRDIIF